MGAHGGVSSDFHDGGLVGFLTIWKTTKSMYHNPELLYSNTGYLSSTYFISLLDKLYSVLYSADEGTLLDLRNSLSDGIIVVPKCYYWFKQSCISIGTEQVMIALT